MNKKDSVTISLDGIPLHRDKKTASCSALYDKFELRKLTARDSFSSYRRLCAELTVDGIAEELEGGTDAVFNFHIFRFKISQFSDQELLKSIPDACGAALEFLLSELLVRNIPDIEEVVGRVLRSSIDDQSPNLKAIECMGELDATVFIPDLMVLLDHSREEVRKASMATLLRLNAKESIPNIQQYLTDRDPDWMSLPEFWIMASINAAYILEKFKTFSKHDKEVALNNAFEIDSKIVHPFLAIAENECTELVVALRRVPIVEETKRIMSPLIKEASVPRECVVRIDEVVSALDSQLRLAGENVMGKISARVVHNDYFEISLLEFNIRTTARDGSGISIVSSFTVDNVIDLCIDLTESPCFFATTDEEERKQFLQNQLFFGYSAMDDSRDHRDIVLQGQRITIHRKYALARIDLSLQSSLVQGNEVKVLLSGMQDFDFRYEIPGVLFTVPLESFFKESVGTQFYEDTAHGTCGETTGPTITSFNADLAPQPFEILSDK